MAIVTSSSALEAWLAVGADAWAPLSDDEYRDLVARWRAAFRITLERDGAKQGPGALQQFESRLPATVLLFNGVAVTRAATGVARHPHAYRAVGLRSLDRVLANQLDLILTDESLLFCCVCTHEWQALAHPIFAKRAP